MFSFEVAQFLTVEEFVKFKQYHSTLPGRLFVNLPDGRVWPWYAESDLHEFMKIQAAGAVEAPIIIHGPDLIGGQDGPSIQT